MSKRPVYALCTALCLLLALTAILSAGVVKLGRDHFLYARCFQAFADTEALGVEKSQYEGLAQSLADYLSGREADLSLFSEKEITHLTDIRQIFAGLDWVCAVTAPAALALGYFLWRRPDPRGFLIGLAAAVLLAAAVTVLILLDFDRAFVLMHRLLFTNDFWLLDPSTDLLICLMPEAMFTFLAVRLAWLTLPAWLLLPTTAALIWQLQKHRDA